MPTRPVSAGDWATFPCSQVPRPLVLIGPRVVLGPGGFTDSAAKIGWSEGAIDATVEVPAAVRDLLPSARRRLQAPVLTITALRPIQGRFTTDRGPRELPAFALHVDGLREPCTVLDPQVPLWWPDPTRRHVSSDAHGYAEIEDDDLTVHFPAFGGVLTEFHHAHFVEHPSYVVCEAITSERPVPLGSAVPALGIITKVTGRLGLPLGGRVLVDTTGNPIEVRRHEPLGPSSV